MYLFNILLYIKYFKYFLTLFDPILINYSYLLKLLLNKNIFSKIVYHFIINYFNSFFKLIFLIKSKFLIFN